MRASSSIPLLVVAIAFALPALAQTDFQYQSYATPGNAGVAIAAPNSRVFDFNSDGYADVLAQSTQTCTGETCTPKAGLYLYMNNGSGALEAPVTLPVTLEGGSFSAMEREVAVADLNGDGKLDIAALNASGGITILYGNGDGTFQTPVTIPLPSPGSMGYASLVNADFEANGKQDLAAMTYTGQLVLLTNNGKGTFTQKTMTIDTPPSGVTTMSLAVGYFTTSGRPDIAWVEDNSTSDSTDAIYIAQNTANGVFGAKQEAGTLQGESYNIPAIMTADVDLDGKTDILGWTSELIEDCCTDEPVDVFYSNGDGTFTATTAASTAAEGVGVADINGDGNPDLLIAGPDGVSVYTGNGNRTFTSQGTYSSLPGAAMQAGFGFFNDTNRIGFAAPNSQSMAAAEYPNDFYPVQNDNAQGNCQYPLTAGVTFCQATQNGDSVTVRGTARASTAPVREIELMANGQELYRVWADEFDATLDVAPGSAITAIEVEANGATKSTTVTPDSGASCVAPSSPGVNVCSPEAGESVTSPVTFIASGTGASGSVNHLELWIDGTKIGNYTGSTMDAEVTEAPGSHTATVIEVDSDGNYVKSTPVSYTVTTGTTGSCAAPSSPGVNVCSPAAGANVTSPVTFIASGTGASGSVNHLELWIDNTKIGNYTGSTMDTEVSEDPGSHTATVVEVDSKGNYVKSTPVSYTVGTSTTTACSAPSSAGVNVCSPKNGSTITSPVSFIASGTGQSGTVNHLELWIDGVKAGNYFGSTIDVNVAEASGSHSAQIIEVDNDGNYVKSTAVDYTVSGTSSTGYQAWVYGSFSGIGSSSSESPAATVSGSEANGTQVELGSLALSHYAASQSPIPMASNAAYLFVTDGESSINAYKIGSNGALTAGAATSTGSLGNPVAAFFDRTGQTLYTWESASSAPNLTSWSIGANGALTQINTVSVNDVTPGFPQVSFTANNTYAYWSDCPGRSSSVFEGFTRASSGALTGFNPNPNIPAAPSGTGYCPTGAAVPDSSHVVIALLDLNNNNFGFYDTQLAVYTIGADGTLTTTNTSAEMPEIGALPNWYVFDPTGTWLAMADSTGLDLFKFSGGVLTHTDSVALSGGVSQVAWDASGHLYAAGSSCCGGYIVYSVSSAGQLTAVGENDGWNDISTIAVQPVQ